MGGKRTRKSLEIETEKVSPPAKMSSRNRSDLKSDEILAKLDAIEARFTNLELEVANMTKALKELEGMRREVDTLKETCDGFKRLELEMKRRSVLVRGLPFKTDKKFETRTQTKEALAGFFERVEMTPHLVDYHRLGGIKQGEDGSKVSIRVQFVNVDQKFELFEKLKESGNALQDISILTDYPSFQMNEFKALSTKAYNIRTAAPGTKTRIVTKGIGLALQKRPRGNDQWMSVSSQGEEPSS